MRLLLVLFVICPLLELWLLLKVGAWLGALPVVALIVASALLGVALLRSAGWQTLALAQSQLRQRVSPLPALLDGFAMAVAGVLLVLPGLLSDGVAALLLIGPLRRWLLRRWRPAMVGPVAGGSAPGPVIIDGDYVVERNGSVERDRSGEFIEHRPSGDSGRRDH